MYVTAGSDASAFAMTRGGVSDPSARSSSIDRPDIRAANRSNASSEK